MLNFKDYLLEKKKGNLKDACWSGYEAIGMKDKGGKKVPNCVPVAEAEICPVCKKDPCECEGGNHIKEGKMSEIASDIEDHIGKHVDNYKKVGGADHLGHQTTKTAEHISKLHGIEQHHAQKLVNDYVESRLNEAATADAKGHKSATGGLTQKGRDAYNREHGSNLKAPVTTPPSKLKAGSKAANRRKSFCARMSGVDGPMKKPNGEPTRKALALRKWNC